MEAIMLMSGGQDSTTCLYWALKKFSKVYAIGFDYGQMHKQEIEQAKKITERLGVQYETLNVKGLLAKSSLTLHENHNKKSYLDNNLPASFTSGRNILFLSIAGSYAAEKGINDIVTGVCQTDFDGYPDCRKTTIDAMQNVLSLGYGNGDYRVHTPLMYLTKAETWKMAKELDCLDIIINDTLTDYDGDMTLNDWGRGNADNPASELRKNGFYEAKEKQWI